MIIQNRQLSKIFHNIASIYQFRNGKNKFRALAYEKASRVISGLPENINHFVETNTVDQIPGIGKTLESNIREFVGTGHIKRFDQLKKTVPYGLLELLEIAGFGAQSLRTIYSRLHLRNKDEVIKALKDGRISKLKGFGPRKVHNMLRGLKLYKALEERMLLGDALPEGERIVEHLKQLRGVRQAELAGSLRRRKETIGDFDILISVDSKERRNIISKIILFPWVKKVITRGDTKISIILKDSTRQVDFRIIEDEEWGSALQYFTGSKEHNIHLRSLAKEQGYKINEYGIFSIQSGKWVAGKTEAEIYRTLGMDIVPPEIRENKGEIKLAIAHKIPKLVELKDIRGDLQMHTNWSDGLQNLDEVVEFTRMNFQYDYIAITDHTQSARIAGGLDEKEILRQIHLVNEINKNLKRKYIKAGTEVEILGNGSLDISDDVLSQLDWVTAAIHSGFNHDNTDRLIKACENPHVHCIGHPTGRLIGKRDSYPLNFQELAKAAAYTGTALEINAQPSRLDLNDEHIHLAKLHHVKLVISSDSHSHEDFYYMRLGVDTARRGWCTPQDILNTRSWEEIEKFKSKKLSSSNVMHHEGQH